MSTGLGPEWEDVGPATPEQIEWAANQSAQQEATAVLEEPVGLGSEWEDVGPATPEQVEWAKQFAEQPPLPEATEKPQQQEPPPDFPLPANIEDYPIWSSRFLAHEAKQDDTKGSYKRWREWSKKNFGVEPPAAEFAKTYDMMRLAHRTVKKLWNEEMTATGAEEDDEFKAVSDALKYMNQEDRELFKYALSTVAPMAIEQREGFGAKAAEAWRRGVSDMSALALRGSAALPGLALMPGVGKEDVKESRDTMRFLSEVGDILSSATPIEGENFAQQAVIGAAQFAPPMLASSGGVLAGAGRLPQLAFWAGQMQPASEDEALRRGSSPEAARLGSWASAVAQAAIELIGPRQLAGFKGAKTMREATYQVAKDTFKEAIVEEGLQGLADLAAQDAMARLSGGDPPDWEEEVPRLAAELVKNAPSIALLMGPGAVRTYAGAAAYTEPQAPPIPSSATAIKSEPLPPNLADLEHAPSRKEWRELGLDPARGRSEKQRQAEWERAKTLAELAETQEAEDATSVQTDRGVDEETGAVDQRGEVKGRSDLREQGQVEESTEQKGKEPEAQVTEPTTPPKVTRQKSEMSRPSEVEGTTQEAEKSEFQQEVEAAVATVPAWKDAEVTVDEERRSARVTTPSGHEADVFFGADEKINALEKKAGRKPGSTKGAYRYQKGGKNKDAGIYLRSNASHTTLNHEAVHWMEDNGIVTSEEVEANGGREGIAKAYAKWVTEGRKEANSVFERIYQFVEGLLNTQKRFFRDIEGRTQATSSAPAATTAAETVPNGRLLTADLEALTDDQLKQVRQTNSDANTRRRAKKILKDRGVEIIGRGKVEGWSQKKPKGRVYEPDREQSDRIADEVDAAEGELKSLGATLDHRSESGSSYWTLPDGSSLRVSDHAVPATLERDSRSTAWDDEVVFSGKIGPEKAAEKIRNMAAPVSAAKEDVEAAKEAGAQEMSGSDVAEVLAKQPGNKGKKPEALADRWIDSESFTLMEIPTDAVFGGEVKEGAKPVTEGPIIVDTNKQSIGRYKGKYGAPAEFVTLDGKHRLQQARDANQPTIQAYVGNKAAEGLKKKMEEYQTRQEEIASLTEKFLDPDNRSPGSQFRQLERLLPNEQFEKLREQRRKRVKESASSAPVSAAPKEAKKTEAETKKPQKTAQQIREEQAASKPVDELDSMDVKEVEAVYRKELGISEEKQKWPPARSRMIALIREERAKRAEAEKKEGVPAGKSPRDMTAEEYWKEVLKYYEITNEAEKDQAQEPLSEEQKRLLDSEDWEAFSRSRGYTEQEIADFRRWTELAPPDFLQTYESAEEAHAAWLSVNTAAQETPAPKQKKKRAVKKAAPETRKPVAAKGEEIDITGLTDQQLRHLSKTHVPTTYGPEDSLAKLVQSEMSRRGIKDYQEGPPEAKAEFEKYMNLRRLREEKEEAVSRTKSDQEALERALVLEEARKRGIPNGRGEYGLSKAKGWLNKVSEAKQAAKERTEYKDGLKAIKDAKAAAEEAKTSEKEAKRVYNKASAEGFPKVPKGQVRYVLTGGYGSVTVGQFDKERGQYKVETHGGYDTWVSPQPLLDNYVSKEERDELNRIEEEYREAKQEIESKKAEIAAAEAAEAEKTALADARESVRRDSGDSDYFFDLTGKAKELKTKKQQTVKIDSSEKRPYTEAKGETWSVWAVVPVLDEEGLKVQGKDGGYDLIHTPTGLIVQTFSGPAKAKRFAIMADQGGLDYGKARVDKDKTEQKRLQQVYDAWDSENLAKITDEELAAKYTAEMPDAGITADMMLDAYDLGARGTPAAMTDRGIEVVKDLVREVPEFQYDPTFIVDENKMLIFRDHYTYKFVPQVFNAHPSELEVGQSVGINLPSLGIELVRDKSVIEKRVLKQAGWTPSQGTKRKRQILDGIVWDQEKTKTAVAGRAKPVSEASSEATTEEKKTPPTLPQDVGGVSGEASKPSLQERAEKAAEEATEELDAFGKLLKGKGLASNPMLDPEVIAGAAKVVAKFAKAGVLKFAAMEEQLRKTLGDAAVNRILPVVKSEWEKLRQSGDVVGMGAIDVETPQQSKSADAGSPPKTTRATPPGSPDGRTGVRHARTDEMRERAGLPERIPAESVPWTEAEAEARGRMEQDPTYAPRLAEVLARNPRPLDQVEQFVLNLYLNDIENRRLAGEDIYDELRVATAASALSGGTIVGRSLQARKAEYTEDGSLESMVRGHLRDMGELPSDEQMKKYEELAEEIRKLQEENEKLRENDVRPDLEKRIKELEAQLKKKPREGLGIRKGASKKRKTAAMAKFKAAFADAVKAAGTTTFTSGGLNPEAVAAVGKLAKAAAEVVKVYVSEGVKSFLHFKASLTKDFGDLTKDQLAVFQQEWEKQKPESSITVDMEKAEIGEAAEHLMKWAVASGITEPELVIDAVHEVLQEAGLSRMETMLAMTRMGEYARPRKKIASSRLAEVRGMIRSLVRLRQIRDGEVPENVEERRRLAEEEKALVRQVYDAMKRSGLSTTDPHTQLTTPLTSKKRAVDKQLEEVDREIADLINNIRSGTRLQEDGTLSELVVDEELVNKQAELEELLKLRESLREESPAYQAKMESKALERFMKTLLRREAFWRNRVSEARKGTFPAPRPTSKWAKDFQKNVQKIEDLKSAYRWEVEMAKRAKWNYGQWTAHWAKESAMILPRGLMAGLELSPVARQAWVYMKGHPIMTLFNLADAMPAVFMQSFAVSAQEKIEQRTDFDEYLEADIEFTTEEGRRVEEMYESEILNYLAEWHHWSLLPAFLGAKGYRMLERGVRTFLNRARADMYDINKRNTLRARRFFEKLGVEQRAWGETDIMEAGNAANIFTGRGTGLERIGKGKTVLDVLAFAKRYVWSRIQSVYIKPIQLLTPSKLGQFQGDPAMRVAYAAMYGQALLGWATHTAVLFFILKALADDDPDTDDEPYIETAWRETDAWRIVAGETRIDLSGGHAKYITMMLRFLSGNKVVRQPNGKLEVVSMTEGWTRGDASLLQEARYKFSVPASAAMDFAGRRNAVGEDLPQNRGLRVAAIAWERMHPMTYPDMWAAEKELGWARGTIMALHAFFGEGVATYGSRTDYRNGNKKERQKQFAKDLKNMKWDTPPLAYREFLSEDQLKLARDKQDEKREKVVYDASHTPDPDSKTIVDLLKKRDANRKALAEMGISHDEAQKLLVESFWRPAEEGGKIRKETWPTQTYRAYKKRGEALAAIYEQDFAKWRKKWKAEEKASDRKAFEARHAELEKLRAPFGRRKSGVRKGGGYSVKLYSPERGFTTEYPFEAEFDIENQKRKMKIPALVPGLTKTETLQMVNDIIPNNKEVPETIKQKAIDHARKRLAEGKDVFAD